MDEDNKPADMEWSTYTDYIDRDRGHPGRCGYQEPGHFHPL